MDVLESKDDVIVDPGVAGAAFMTSLAALVQASQAGNPLDEQSLRFCVETLDGRITELKVRSCVCSFSVYGATVCARRGHWSQWVAVGVWQEDVFATVKGHWAVFQDSFLCADQLGTKVVSIRQALLKLITALRSQGVVSLVLPGKGKCAEVRRLLTAWRVVMTVVTGFRPKQRCAAGIASPTAVCGVGSALTLCVAS